jgi:ABC-2 type transport system ATP-binding protein
MMNLSTGGAPPAIRVEGLRVVRGGRTVLDGLDLTVPTGAVTGLLGPSGCGKTTLMRAIVGVQIVRSGTIEVLGEPAGSAPLRKRVGYVTQAPSVYAKVLRAPAGDADRVIEAVGLGECGGDMVSRLSGGQRARVSLAAALLGTPELLVLDEPTVGLDPVLRRDLWGLFHDLAHTGVTLLVSSHVMDEAERCDELLLMRAGRILAQSAPSALLSRTGAATVEDAFLRLVDADAEAQGAAV